MVKKVTRRQKIRLIELNEKPATLVSIKSGSQGNRTYHNLVRKELAIIKDNQVMITQYGRSLLRIL